MIVNSENTALQLKTQIQPLLLVVNNYTNMQTLIFFVLTLTIHSLSEKTKEETHQH